MDVYALRISRTRLKRLQARLRAKGIETWKKVGDRPKKAKAPA